MYLHRLTFQAIGPFPGRHTIDFASLGSSGLFLLEGPTGSGKSTVIDAIVFALYGKVASADASEDRMRSDHAGPTDDSMVDLVFEVTSGIFRVLRTPRFERPKQRGEGTTTQQATVKLWRLTSPDAPEDGELLSARLDEAGIELPRIVGLDRDQFVKTVVLPQGEFARFLQEKPEDRRGVLQKVFGTQVYERIERQLATMRADAQKSLEAARGEVGRAVAGFVGAARLPDDVAAPLREAAAVADVDTDALAAAVTALTSDAARDAEVAAQAVVAATATLVDAVGVRDAARATVQAVQRRDGLLADRDRLAGLAAEHRADVERRLTARRARLAMPAVAGVRQAIVAVAEAERAAAQARADAGARNPDLLALVAASAEPTVQVSALAGERELCTATRARLEHVLALEDALHAQRIEADALAEQSGARAAERAGLAGRIGARPGERAALRARLDGLAAAADRLGPAQAALVGVQVRRGAAVELAGLAPQVAGAEATVRAATGAASEANARVAELRQRRIAGIAAELAVDLVPGGPCPVCGGTDHPHIAAPAPEAVTADAVTEAESVRTAAEVALRDAGDGLTRLRTRAEAAAEAADGWEVPTADARLAEAAAAVAAAQDAARDRDVTGAELDAFDAGTRDLEAGLAALDVQAETDRARLATRRAAIADAVTEVDAARGSAPTVRARVADLDARLTGVAGWLAEVERLVVARDRVAERTVELDAALAEHGFTSAVAGVGAGAGADEVVAASLPDAALAALDQRIADHDLAVARVADGLADEAVAGLPAELTAEAARVALAEASAAHTVADAEATRAGGELARLRDRAAASAGARDGVVRAIDLLTTARATAGPVVRMANVAAASGGDNARQLSLGTYVLARRFEDVVAAANGRLAVMSSGRYELLRSEERESGGARKLGLALTVVDHHTELNRGPKTLSGGETFYFALALALGLADVVTAEAGGTDLGTLFVDEGFGSLDGDTLDVVLAELGRLRDSGRVVGVVSHVEAMKQAIAERVEVRRTAEGWSTLVVRA